MIRAEKLKEILFNLPDVDTEPAENLEVPYENTDGQLRFLSFSKIRQFNGFMVWVLKID